MTSGCKWYDAMYKQIDTNSILVETLLTMKPKIKKSLLNTDINEREDLEQEIIVKIVEAVINKKIEIPPTFSAYMEKSNNEKSLTG